MKRQSVFLAILAAGVLAFGFLAARPWMFWIADGSVVLAFPVQRSGEFTIRFIHSVQKTPVEENLRVNEALDGFVLESTRYQSFGVGLPFMMEEGDFKREGDFFIFSHMDRPIKNLALRFIESNQFTVIYRGKEYPLQGKIKPGVKITVKIEPYYKRFLHRPGYFE